MDSLTAGWRARRAPAIPPAGARRARRDPLAPVSREEHPMTRSIATRSPATTRRRRAFLPQAEGLEGRQLLSAGQLDLTFGSGTGYTQVEATIPSRAWTVQIQSDGKILAAGNTLYGTPR